MWEKTSPATRRTLSVRAQNGSVARTLRVVRRSPRATSPRHRGRWQNSAVESRRRPATCRHIALPSGHDVDSRQRRRIRHSERSECCDNRSDLARPAHRAPPAPPNGIPPIRVDSGRVWKERRIARPFSRSKTPDSHRQTATGQEGGMRRPLRTTQTPTTLTDILRSTVQSWACGFCSFSCWARRFIWATQASPAGSIPTGRATSAAHCWRFWRSPACISFCLGRNAECRD